MSLNSKTVLVVDDEPVLRAIVREILDEEGYAVIEAADGRVMLEIMARERPDLVLMDVMMPGVDGREAYRQLRSRPEHRDVPVVMMSAAIQSHGLDPSIAGFMAKPFDITELVALVVRLIGHPRANGCGLPGEECPRRDEFTPVTLAIRSRSCRAAASPGTIAVAGHVIPQRLQPLRNRHQLVLDSVDLDPVLTFLRDLPDGPQRLSRRAMASSMRLSVSVGWGHAVTPLACGDVGSRLTPPCPSASRRAG